MNNRKPREFKISTATRAQVPLIIGIAGPSGGGKTFSALRLATGIQRVLGGDIYGIDTESNRMLHYADRFRFKHLPFGAPFDPLSYLDAIQYAYASGGRIIVVDSMSHEHEGPGGVLEMHAAAVQRMAKGDDEKAERVKMLAWSGPKQERRRLINTMIQIPAHFVFCFRAKEKIKVVPSQQPKQLGWMPIAGDEFVYEMTTCCLLKPNAKGVPDWAPTEDGEKQMVKLPEQFRKLLTEHKGPLDEGLGQSMAEWAVGTDPLAVFKAQIEGAKTLDELAAVWKAIPATSKKQLESAKDARKAAIQSGAGATKPEAEPATVPAPKPSFAALTEAMQQANVIFDDVLFALQLSETTVQHELNEQQLADAIAWCRSKA